MCNEIFKNQCVNALNFTLTLQPVKTLIFDFDGTIADSISTGLEIANSLADEFKYKKVDKSELPHYRGLSSREIIRELGISYFRLPFLVRRLRKAMRERLGELLPFDGIQEELSLLKKKGFNMGILTSNSKENVTQFLTNNEWEQYFRFVDSGVKLFQKSKAIKSILKKQGLNKSQVMLIGDESRDIEAARKCGIFITAVSWGFHTRDLLKSCNPDFLIDNPSEISVVLESVNSGRGMN